MLIYIIAAIASAIAFGLIKLIAPHEERNSIDEELLQKNVTKYAGLEVMSIIPLFLFMGILMFAVYAAGNFMAHLLEANDNSKFLFIPGSMSWLMPALIMGFGLVVIPMDYLYKFLLKDEYDLYLEYTNRKHGYDGWKIMKPVSRILIIVGVICFVLLLNVYVRATEDSIYVNDFFSFIEKQYELDEVDAIHRYYTKVAPNGTIVEQERIIVSAGNQKIWNSESGFIDYEEEKLNKFIRVLSERNQIEIQNKGIYRE